MFPKKLCSLGILDININLILRKDQAENYNFDINKYNKVEDLESLFFQNETKNSINTENENEKNQKVNYFEFISLSSDNNLINTLLYINRAYRIKTFIEFIMLNQMEFSHTTKFVRKFLQKVFNKNYFFIIENKILDIPSKVKFKIKILNNDDDQIISMKSFELFEINDIEVEQQFINIKIEEISSENNEEESDNNFFYENKYRYIPILNMDKINYNFGQTDYFLIDLSIIKDLKLSNNKDFALFIFEIIKNYPKIKIVLIIDDNINDIEKEYLKLNKQLIELSDIIFSFQDKLNNFFQIYNSTIKNNTKELKNINYFIDNLEVIGNSKPRIYNLLIDDQDKCRKNIPRISVLFDDFLQVTIYKQIGLQMKIDSLESYKIETSKSKNERKINYLNSNYNIFYHIFIAGFLSRMINEKSYRICVGAGDLLIKKNLYLLMNNIDYINDIDQFNVLVPNIKGSKLRKLNQKIIREYENLLSKENKFILDCTNVLKSRKKDYNPLLDQNCANYLLKDHNIKHLKEVGFINKKGIILKDPDSGRKKEKKRNVIKTIIKNRILTETNFFLPNNIPFNKTNYNTFNTINSINSNKYETPRNIKIPKINFNFIPKFESIHHNLDFLSPNLKTISNYPKMSKTCYNYSSRESKTTNYKASDLRKYKIKSNIIYKSNINQRNLSFNKGKNINKKSSSVKYRKFHLNLNNNTKFIKNNIFSNK